MTNLISEVRAALQAANADYTPETARLMTNAPTWLQQLSDRLEEAVKALEWYAAEENNSCKEGNFIKAHTNVQIDYGATARATLKRIKGENG